MLIKFKVRRVKDNPDKKVEYLSGELVGTVKSIYKFNNFADYQYLPLIRNEQTGETENIYRDIVPQNILESPSWFKEKPNLPIFLPPILFSRNDVVQPSMLRNEQKLLSNAEADEVVNFAVTNRTSRLIHSTMIPFDLTSPIPTQPKEVVDILKANLMKEADYKTIVDLFERRPIWTISALRCHMREPPKKMSNLLAQLAYFYTNGPWRNCFVKFGYDPRNNFHSRYYQMLDYRVRQTAGFKIDAKNKRQSAVHKRPREHKIEAAADSTSADTIELNFQLRREKSIFGPDSLPPPRARQYQLIDIHLPKVQEMLESIPTPMSGVTCDEKRGWLPNLCLDDIRAIITTIAQQNLMKESKEKKEIAGAMNESSNEEEFDDDSDEDFEDEMDDH
jgi:general transcription factor 3C polypeptide 5 (transcription factor C subunit 1)